MTTALGVAAVSSVSIIVVVMLIAGGIYFWSMRELGILTWGQLAGRDGGLVLFLASLHSVRRGMLRGDLGKFRFRIFLALAPLGALSAQAWLSFPMHDIALFFDSHGRWGCRQAGLILTDTTLPWIVIVPTVMLVALHLRRAGKLAEK